MIKYSSKREITTKQLDSLWNSIGWKSRGAKWNNVLRKSTFVYSAWDGKKLIGLGRVLEDGVMCMFYDIGVHPDYQGHGIGTKIMQTLINKVKRKGYVSLGLFTLEQNSKNIPFYEKFGFKHSSGMELTKFMKPE